MPYIKLPVLYIVEMEMMNQAIQKQNQQQMQRGKNLRKEVLRRKANLIQKINSRSVDVSCTLKVTRGGQLVAELWPI